MPEESRQTLGGREQKRRIVIAAAVLILIALIAVVTLSAARDKTPELPVQEEIIPGSEEVLSDEDYDPRESALDEIENNDVVLHETQDAGEDYINGTLFIGDSNTVRYIMSGCTTAANCIGVVSMRAEDILTLPCVSFAGYSDMVTVPEAVKIMQPQRVVFGFGTNNLGELVQTYIAAYEKGIRAAYEAYPYFDIMICAVPPVAQERLYTNVSMQKIDAFNLALVEMCRSNGWKFLNTSSVLKDPANGFAKPGFTDTDGLHLTPAAVGTVFQFIRTHAYATADRRPRPLRPVPEHLDSTKRVIFGDPLLTLDVEAGKPTVPEEPAAEDIPEKGIEPELPVTPEPVPPAEPQPETPAPEQPQPPETVPEESDPVPDVPENPEDSAEIVSEDETEESEDSLQNT